MIVRSTYYTVSYRNVDGVMREHIYATWYHANQFARAIKYAGLTEIELIERKA